MPITVPVPDYRRDNDVRTFASRQTSASKYMLYRIESESAHFFCFCRVSIGTAVICSRFRGIFYPCNFSGAAGSVGRMGWGADVVGKSEVPLGLFRGELG